MAGIIESIPLYEWAILIGLLVTFLFGTSVTTFIILSKLRWPFKVNALEDVAGQGYVISIKDRARLIAFGDGGEEIFLLKKTKKYRVGYGKRIGNKVIGWAIGNDGYWYNFTFGNFNKNLLELGVVPVDRDMRFATASLRKGIESRYNDKKWMDKYGTILYFGMFILTLLIFAGVMWFAFNQQGKIASTNLESIKLSKEVMLTIKDTLISLDNLRGGSGLTPAVPNG